MNINDGGPAFPRPVYYPDDPCSRLEPGEQGGVGARTRISARCRCHARASEGERCQRPNGHDGLHVVYDKNGHCCIQWN